MREFNQNTVSVLFYFDGREQYARPVRLLWRGAEYELGTVQFWHTTHHGSRLTHHYTVSDRKRQFIFRLALDTEDLIWTLEGHSEQPKAARPPLTRLVGALS